MSNEAKMHDHVDGVFCDDCPDALRQNLKRMLVQHRWNALLIGADSDCTCGWVMPFEETHQHAAHVADVIAAELANLGWMRNATKPTQEEDQ